MYRIFTVLAVILLILAVIPQPVWGKSPTAKITISGGALASAVEVTEPRILGISNVWGGQFLDFSQGIVEERPVGLRS